MILNLILYNNGKEYHDMRDVVRIYLDKVGIKHFFYYYDENIQSDYVIDGDVLRIKGNETFVPGIFKKTIKAIEICLNNQIEFDYIVRSNISTIVDFYKLDTYLQTHTLQYGGPHIFNLDWLDPPLGIHDHRYDGLNYIAGTGIIISKDMAKFMIEKQDDMNYDVIDDVGIGLFFQKYNIKISNLAKEYVYGYNMEYSDKRVMFYRNKRDNRNNDVKHMKTITEQLISTLNNGSNDQQYAYYGANGIYNDVLDIIMKKFVKDRILRIPRNTNKNLLFGDPVYGIAKKLILKLGNGKEIQIDEYMMNDIIVKI